MRTIFYIYFQIYARYSLWMYAMWSVIVITLSWYKLNKNLKWKYGHLIIFQNVGNNSKNATHYALWN